jgi:hypothetical protein
MADYRCGIDMDGCLSSWCVPFAKLLAQVHGSDLLPEGWEQRDHKDFICWDWASHYGYSDISIELAHHEFCDSGDSWYRLPELPEAQEVLDALNWLVDADVIDLYFITTRAGVRAKQQTEMWLYDRGIMTPTVLVTGNKVPVIEGLGLQFYLDDRLETITQASEAGLRGVYLLDRPWNREGRPAGLSVALTAQEALRDAELWVDLTVQA